MKPIITVKLFRDDDKVAEIETDLVTRIYDLFRTVEFDAGTIRVTYGAWMYNEASFETQAQCKVLATIFREKPLLDYIYNREL